jgi:HEAT repeat protein
MEVMTRRNFRNHEIASALVKMGKYALPAIVERFVRVGPRARIRLVDLVDRMGPSMAGALAAALEDPHPEVRLVAVERLSRKGRSVAALITPLAARLRDDYVCVRIGAIRALAMVSGPTSVSALRIALRDPCGLVRHAVAMSLGSLGPEAAAAVPELIWLVQSDHSYVRYEAVLALTAIGPAARAALPALRAARSDAREPLRFAIDKAIAMLE